MPPTPLRSSSAIFRLNSDILRRIFAFNAKEYTSLTRLETLHRASHVCSGWRELILESPALWSHSYDIGSLNYREEWQREVLKRTGNCTLRVKANKETIAKMDKFIQTVLSENWDRIRYLDIQFSYWCSPAVSWIPLLERSAPSLETFRMTFQLRYPCALSSRLFAKNAPSLRNFVGINTTWDPTTVSWASNIRRLTITSFFSIVKLLHSLLITPLPNLEHLELADDFDDENVQRTNGRQVDKVHLANFPRLERIKISLREGIETVLSLLDRITPRADCTFEFLYTPITDVLVVHDTVQAVFSNIFQTPEDQDP
ncbi:hypothetical protein GALMADRAFT_217135 [Galerina marginata CBS 339.88]|uniref:Uncharacterized protein n=1 Tax=Galerina marginata (strain CBS 339.88) TaxID=685588 RepID=A0A067SEU5_GALM3|nr:hypothetical protein GALMADRAFT_217135 [Galerina marginata CBS 339.88]